MPRKGKAGKATNESRFTAVASGFELPEIERGILDLWRRERAFEVLRERNAGKEPFRFFDGPITANAESMGIHHAWARTYKDLYQRYKAMDGFDQRYQNGFDCQGLWVEVQVEKELQLNSKRDIEAYGIDRFSEACRARVDRSAAAFTDQSIRLGQWMDWDHSYYTYDDNNISHIWQVLKICREKGWLYKGHRAMPWCARCGTALSQHEMIDSYREMTHLSVYVKLPVEGRDRESFLVWTTTPWTLTANVALAVHPEFDYARVRLGEEVLILSRDVFNVGGWEGAEILETLKGEELLGLRYRGPFDELPAAAATAVPAHRVIAWHEVSSAEGTGIVHIAPGCGAEDFALSKTEKLPVLVPIDDQARYVKGFGWLEGREAREVAQDIADDLQKRGLLFRASPYTHRYPECWRCHEEIVFRVDDEWFIAMDELRPQLIAAAETVGWIPAQAGKRMRNWLENMGDWNISRKRYWGLPLPFYTCTDGHFFVLGSAEELRERALRGLDELRELHRPWIDSVVVGCPECGAESTRVSEVGDCWLDAGVIPFSTLDFMHDRANWERWFPADYVVEMIEQVRLWFYSLLFFSVVQTGKAPYEVVGTFQPMMAAPGEEFHKTGGNSVSLSEAMDKVGADIIRWSVTRQNAEETMYFGWGPLEDIKRRLLTLWNTYSFFVTYANLDGFDPNEPQIPVAERPVIDRWLISSLARLVRDCRSALDRYDAQEAALRMETFWEELSTWYVRLNRRRFWKAGTRQDSLAAYQTLHHVLTVLVRLFAPVMPFLAEAMYQNLARGTVNGAQASVHHTAYPRGSEDVIDEELERRMRATMRVVALGRAARAAARVKVRTPLSKLIAVFDATDRDRGLLDGSGELADLVKDELNVKAFEVRDEAEGLVETKVKPDLKVLGPKLGKDLPRIRTAFHEGRFRTVDDEVEVEGMRFSVNELLIEHIGTPGHAVGRDAGAVAALVTEVTPELEREGLARELAHHVNNLRKEAGLDIADRIHLRISGDLAAAVQPFREFIAAETLATSVTDDAGAGTGWAGELNGVAGTIALERAV